MTDSLRQFWASRAPRQRTLLVAMLLLLAAAFYLWLLLWADPARSRLQVRVGELQQRTTQFNRDADEFEQLQALPVIAAPSEDLYPLLQARLAAGSGLLSADVRMEAAGKDRVTVELHRVVFAQWLGWVEDMAAQRIQLESCRIEASASPGMVSVSATLVRTLPP